MENPEDNPDEKSFDFSIKQEDLEKIAVLYDGIREIWKSLDPDHDKILAENFDNSIKTIMGELSEVAKSGGSEDLLNIHMLKAKSNLNQMCFSKLIDYTKQKSPETTEIIEKLYDLTCFYQQTSFDFLLKTANNNLISITELSSLKEKLHNSFQEELSKQESNLIELFNKEREELMSEITSLQEENKKYLDTLIKRTKSSAEIAIQKPVSNIMPLAELKDIITSVYNSKANYDLNQLEGSPRQTMITHMHIFLCEKYQSRVKAIKKASEIVSAIKKYSNDIDVLLFAKILRNDCDENYRFLHDQIKETVVEITKQHTKTDELKHNSWTEIVNFVYDEKDSNEMLSYIATQKKNHSTLTCAELINYILYFQLKSHEKYISKFNYLFKSIDTDLDGIISEEEFLALCSRFELNISPQDMSKFLQLIDPYSTQQITYSDCIAVFSTELVTGKSNPILQELT